MNRKLLVVATVVLVGGGAVAVFGAVQRHNRSSHPRPAETSAHGNGIDRAMSAVVALYHAPEGATPCESAYNAFKASQDVATREQVTPVVIRLAPRDDFLARCRTLPSATQQCIVPRYLSAHRPECQGAKPADDVLAAMVEVKHAVEPGSPGAAEEPLEPSPMGSQ